MTRLSEYQRELRENQSLGMEDGRLVLQHSALRSRLSLSS